ncbi:hypothetical protein LTR95_011374 [Oleoguttula sp. CCFEE 5521]
MFGPLQASAFIAIGVELSEHEHREDSLPREGGAGSPEASPTTLTIAEIKRHRDCLAETYGVELAVDVVASSLCVAKRDMDAWMSRGPEIEIFTQIMQKLDVPNTEGRFAGVPCDVDGTPDEHQIGILVRAFEYMRDQYARKQRKIASYTSSETGTDSEAGSSSSKATSAGVQGASPSGSNDAIGAEGAKQERAVTGQITDADLPHFDSSPDAPDAVVVEPLTADESGNGENDQTESISGGDAAPAQKRSYTDKESSGSAEDRQSLRTRRSE